jgi:Condensation domain
VFHHTIFDGSSYSIWQRDVTAMYRHLATGSPPQARPATAYSDLVAKQQEQAVRHRSYWESRLPKVPPRLDLPVAHREPLNVWRSEVVPLEISPKAFDRLSKMRITSLHVSSRHLQR